MLLPLLALAVATCAPEQARYVLRGDPAISARFLVVAATPDWPAGLALRLHSARSGRDYDFLPWSGGSDERQHLASTASVTAAGWQVPAADAPRPLGDVEYLGFDASYALEAEMPRRGGQAPAHFLLPDLREALWYHAAADQREGTARQFFDQAGCRAQD